MATYYTCPTKDVEQAWHRLYRSLSNAFSFSILNRLLLALLTAIFKQQQQKKDAVTQTYF